MIRCKKPWTYEEDKDALKIITTNTNLNTVKWAEVSLLHVFHCGDKFRKKYYKTENKWDKHSMTNMLKVVWNARWSIPPPDKTAWYQRYWSQDFLDHRMTELLAPVIGIATFCRWIWEKKNHFHKLWLWSWASCVAPAWDPITDPLNLLHLSHVDSVQPDTGQLLLWGT